MYTPSAWTTASAGFLHYHHEVTGETSIVPHYWTAAPASFLHYRHEVTVETSIVPHHWTAEPASFLRYHFPQLPPWIQLVTRETPIVNLLASSATNVLCYQRPLLPPWVHCGATYSARTIAKALHVASSGATQSTTLATRRDLENHIWRTDSY